MKKLISLLCLPVVVLVGCSDSKTANKTNFEKAISNWIEKNPPCISVPRSPVMPAAGLSDSGFPRYVDRSSTTYSFQAENRARDAAPFEALADAGLLTASDADIEVKGSFGDGPKQVPVRAYALSDKGKAAVSTPDHRFCYGTPKVLEIGQFTEPGEMMGVKLSRVSYRYHLSDLPDWTRNEKVRAAFPQVARDSADSIDAKTTLILTSEGWVHEKSAKR